MSKEYIPTGLTPENISDINMLYEKVKGRRDVVLDDDDFKFESIQGICDIPNVRASGHVDMIERLLMKVMELQLDIRFLRYLVYRLKKSGNCF